MSRVPLAPVKAAGESAAWLYGTRLLALVAWTISAYLLWGSFAGDRLPGCGPESACDEVLSSRWGYWLGVPVSLGALLVYALVLGATFGLGRSRGIVTRHRAWWVLTFAAVVIPAAALWFIGVQWILLGRFCPYCLTAHICGSVMSGLVVLRLYRRVPLTGGSGTGGRGTVITLGQTRAAIVAGLFAVVALVAGQVLHQPRTIEVRSPQAGAVSRAVRPAAVSPPPDVGRATPLKNPTTPGLPSPPPSVREWELHGGAFRLDLHTTPLYGRPDAPHVVVSLFDYTCNHCRNVHQHLMEVHRSLSNQLAIVSLPVPLDQSCNPVVKRALPEHTNACVYARLGLAVWRADRTRMEAFDDWMFSSPRPPSVNEARARAAGLVGTNTLDSALKDPWIDQLIQTSIRLYHTNYLVYGQGRLPQLILGTNLASGQLRDTRQLYQLLSTNLRLAPPAPPGSPP